MALNGCNGRSPFRETVLVQDGWSDGQRIMKTIPFVMSKTCNYTLSDLGRVDPGCKDCNHKEKA